MEADLIVTNGAMHTMEPARPRVSALAVRRGRIVGLGDTDEVRRLAGPRTQVLDLAGRAAIPGLTDAHLHFVSYGLSLEEVDLAGTRSLDEALARVAARAAATPRGEWVRGRGWDRNLWSPPAFPGRQALDSAAPEHPAAFPSKDGHALWVNSLAMRALGIDAATPDPKGGRIVRDAQGEPAGVLLERAIEEFWRRVPAPGPEARRRAALAAGERALQVGLTGVHDCEGAEEMAALASLWREGALKVRVYAHLAREALPAALALGLVSGLGDEWLRVGHLKLFADGSLGSRTADMLAPYEGEPGNTGVTVLDDDELRAIVEEALRAGIAPAVHAIGDRAGRRVLDVFAATRPLWAPQGLRPRIEHAQLLAPVDLPRPGALGVVASMQPIHAVSDMEMAEAYWGARSAGAYAWRSLREGGAVLAFGSDCPVESLDPLAGIYAAVARRRPDGTPAGGWRMEQALTVAEAVRAYTWGAAYAAGEERDKGSLALGKVADLVVLSGDILELPIDEVPGVRVEATVCGGRLAWSRGEVGV